MSALFHCVVPGKPVPQGRMRHTRTGTARGYSTKSQAHRKMLVATFGYLHRIPRPIDQPVSVLVEIAGAHGASDCDNHGKQVLDALVSAEVLAKDSVMVVRELVVRVVDGEPRTAVTITAHG